MDDYWEESKLERQMNVFKSDSNVAMVYSNYFFKNEIKQTKKVQYKVKLPEGIIVDLLLRKHIVGLLTMVIDRKFFDEKNKPFDPRLHFIGDFDVAIKISAKHKVACVQQPLATYRWHGNNETALTKDRQIKELQSWGKEMQNYPEISNNEGFEKFLNNTKYLEGMQFVMRGELRKAFKSLLSLSCGMGQVKLFISIIMQLKILKIVRT